MELRETTKRSGAEQLTKRLEKLESRIEDLENRNAELQVRNAKLQEELAKARKNSSTSSKPPSSDIVNPDKNKAKGNRRRGKRKQGGQPGHSKHERPDFPPEMLDNVWEYHRGTSNSVCGDRSPPLDKITGPRELAANRDVAGANGSGQPLLPVTVPAVMSSTSFIKLFWPTGTVFHLRPFWKRALRKSMGRPLLTTP